MPLQTYRYCPKFCNLRLLETYCPLCRCGSMFLWGAQKMNVIKTCLKMRYVQLTSIVYILSLIMMCLLKATVVYMHNKLSLQLYVRINVIVHINTCLFYYVCVCVHLLLIIYCLTFILRLCNTFRKML